MSGGTNRQAKGRVKEAAGALTGDRKLKSEGKVDQAAGKVKGSRFAFSSIIAIKASSPAINDPTTAVLAIDQLHRLLRMVGRRHLHNEAVFDGARQLRVILRTPNWQDFVNLVFSSRSATTAPRTSRLHGDCVRCR